MKILIKRINTTSKEHEHDVGYTNFDHIEDIFMRFNTVFAILNSGQKVVLFHDWTHKAETWLEWFDEEISYISKDHTDGLHILDYSSKMILDRWCDHNENND